jgi:hypothetical protein
METKYNQNVKFNEQPRIANRLDALELLDILIKAESVEDDFYALFALRDAIKREII